MKFVIAVLVVLLLALQYRLWVSDDGLREVARLRDAIAEQRLENERLRERNRTLAAEVQDLKKGTTAIEERARTDLGMIRNSETFYQVATPRMGQVSGEAAAEEAHEPPAAASEE
jgi:cell division protein FtsB